MRAIDIILTCINCLVLGLNLGLLAKLTKVLYKNPEVKAREADAGKSTDGPNHQHALKLGSVVSRHLKGLRDAALPFAVRTEDGHKVCPHCSRWVVDCDQISPDCQGSRLRRALLCAIDDLPKHLPHNEKEQRHV